MSRSTNTHYLQDRAWLTRLWESDSFSFTGLTFTEQRALHDFFDPTTNRDEAAALAYRREVTADEPSLPQRAGKALKELRFQVDHAFIRRPVPQVVQGYGRQRSHAISVSALARPHPDYAKLSRALVQLAEELRRNGGALPPQPDDRRRRSPRRPPA